MYPETILLTCNQIISTKNLDLFKRVNNCPDPLIRTLFFKKSMISQKDRIFPLKIPVLLLPHFL